MFYRLKGQCVVKDSDGTDGQLDFKTPTQSSCLTACSIAEQGQSGQPAYVQEGENFVVRGVLSHGPPAGQCNGFDTYTEVDKLHFNFLNGVSHESSCPSGGAAVGPCNLEDLTHPCQKNPPPPTFQRLPTPTPPNPKTRSTATGPSPPTRHNVETGGPIAATRPRCWLRFIRTAARDSDY
jgi:hypothetical protein